MYFNICFRGSPNKTSEPREAPPSRTTVTSAWTDVTSNATQQPSLTSGATEGWFCYKKHIMLDRSIFATVSSNT